jgi:hypothetical protein
MRGVHLIIIYPNSQIENETQGPLSMDDVTRFLVHQISP